MAQEQSQSGNFVKSDKFDKVENLDRLKELLKDGDGHEFFILLKLGGRSWKTISIEEDGKFYVEHQIDGSEETLTEIELVKSNIGTALNNGALYFAW